MKTFIAVILLLIFPALLEAQTITKPGSTTTTTTSGTDSAVVPGGYLNRGVVGTVITLTPDTTKLATQTNRGTDTTRAVVREGAKWNKTDTTAGLLVTQTMRGADSTRAIVREGAYRLKSTILAYFGCGADSGNTVSADKYPMQKVPIAVIVDSVGFTFYSGSSPSMTPTLSYGPDIAAAGTSFGSFSAVTATRTVVVVPSATTVPVSQDVWVSWTFTVKPKRWSAVVYGHTL